MSTVDIQEVSIKTSSDYSLSATRFLPQRTIYKTIIISSATGVLQGYYSSFATHFASLGYTVYTFDYSGIGKSGSGIKALKENTTTLRGWGRIDQAAVIAHAHRHDPRNKIILVPHSVGGQILGFNPNYMYLDKIVMIASQTGYWRYYKGIHLPKMWLFWYVLIPGTTFLFDYFPAKRLRLFENLPKTMVLEWMKWGKKKQYMMAFHNDTEYFFDKIRVPLLSLSFPKDPFAPPKAVDWLTGTFRNADTTRIHFKPAPKEIQKLRHFGFFRKRFKVSLWNMVDEWIKQP